MLVLSRKIGQSIVIDGQICVTVLSTKGPVVRMGVTAPSHVPVHRDEVHQRILAESGGGQPRDCSHPDAA